MKRIVIQVHDMVSDKRRRKAMKIAAVCQGVQSVSIEGESHDQVAVTGVGIDSVCLANHLRKKFRSATIVSVEDVKVEETVEENEVEESNAGVPTIAYRYAYYPPPYPTYYVYEDPQPNGCFFF